MLQEIAVYYTMPVLYLCEYIKEKKRQDKRISVARFRAKFRIQDLSNTNNGLLSCLQKTFRLLLRFTLSCQ